MGTLKGEIVRGTDLGSADGRRPKKTTKLRLRKPKKSSGGGLASRYAVLTVRTEGLFDPSREIQVCLTSTFSLATHCIIQI